MNKKLLILVIALAVLVGALAAAYFLTRPQATDGMKSFTLEIVHGDKTVKSTVYQTAEEFLGAYLLAEGIIKGENGQYGLYITEVDGEKAVYEEDNAYWCLFVNGEYAQLGIDQTPIEEGAVYQLAYTPA